MKTKNFLKHPLLSKFFKLTSVSQDSNGTEFIASIEGRKFPIYGVQYHPEKNAFEWHTDISINHQPEAVEVSQHLANFFVNEARKSNHSFTDANLERNSLIYNYNPLKWHDGFNQVYVFKNRNITSTN